MEKLLLSERVKNSSNSAKKERKKGFVPGVIYGKEIGNLMFEIGAADLISELKTTGEHGVINFELGGQSGTAVIKDIQKDAITHKVVHIDLEEVEADQEIIAEVPIKFNGKDFLSSKGVVLQSQKDTVKVSCTPENLPNCIEVDVRGAEPGAVFKLADLEVGSEISVLDDLASVCAAVVTQKYTAEDAELDAEEEVSEEEK